MREPLSFDIASLDKTPQFAPSEKSGEGIFISNSARFYLVTALLWVGIIAGSACAWVGVFAIGVKVAHWMGA